MNAADRLQMFANTQRATKAQKDEQVSGSRRDLLCRSALLGLGQALPALAFARARDQAVPILVYHRFAQTVRDSMTVRTATFSGHLAVLQELGCEVIPLRELIAFRTGKRDTLPYRAVVITADDGHRSQFEVMAPMLADQGLCATFFIYPSAISNAEYAMTWLQLQAMALRSQWDFGSHTQWHPHLLRDRLHLPPGEHLRFVDQQLNRSREILTQRLARPIDWLAWPFGLEDQLLRERARACGYQAAFSLGNRPNVAPDDPYAMPRYLVTDEMDAKALSAHLSHAFRLNSR